MSLSPSTNRHEMAGGHLGWSRFHDDGLLCEHGPADLESPIMRVLVASEVRLLREGLAEILGQLPELTVAGVAMSATEVLERVAELRPDVALVDVSMPESLACVRAAVRLSPGTKVLALGIADDDASILSCAEAGVSGFITRDGSLDELVSAIECVAREELACSRRAAAVLLRQVGALAVGPTWSPSTPGLTAREREVLSLLDRRLTNKEIADQLGIEVATVKNHVHNLLEKLKVHRRRDAVATAGASSRR
jgi:two-component system, NarL family, nitrate/nitrite response regulator NarL